MNVRIRGNGLLVIPKGKFRFERDVTPVGRRAGSTPALSPFESIASENVEVLPAPGAREWRIETSAYSIAWPAGFVVTDDPDELSPFLLEGAREALIWTTGPVARDKVLPIEKLATDDQRIRAIADAGEDARIDLDYVLDDDEGVGEPWWQRRYVRVVPGGAIVLSAQARATDEDTVRSAIDAIDASLVVTSPS